MDTDPLLTTPGRRTRRAIAVVALLALALGIGGVVWFLRGAAPEAVDLDAAVAELEASSGAEATREDTSASDGTWVVDRSIGEFSITDSTGSFVGVRMDEELEHIGATTAVVRTPEVSGSVELDGTTLTAAAFEADFTTLLSDRSRREAAVQRALETGTYPTAAFTLTEPVELDALPQPGSPVSVTVPGELTIHGITNTVEVPLQIAVIDGVALITGSFALEFSDYGVTAPSAPIVLSVADSGTVELQLHLTPA